ncbi:MAG: hypothetical protein ACI4ST_08095 [Candidatus Gallimonas sp.]
MKRTNKLFAICLALVLCLTFGLTVGCSQGKTPEESTTYTVTLPSGLTGGTVTADKTSVKEGENVVVTATPDDSYELDWIKFDGVEQTKASNNRYEINNVRKNITVTAAFKLTVVPSMFTSFPDDVLINSYQDLTYYVNAEGEQTYRSDLPTVVEGARLGILVTMKAGTVDEQIEYFASDENYAIAGGVKAIYSENGFNEGILTDVSNGIYMKPNCAYEISYTASKDNRTETRVQTVLVAKTYDLVSDMFGPTFENLDDDSLINLEVVDAPSAMFGENKVLKLHNAAGATETSGFFSKEGIWLGTENTSDFQWVIYNDSDTEVILACKASSNVMDPKLAPHSYMIWNPYSRPYFQGGATRNPIFETHGYINGTTGELNQLQFTVVPTGTPQAEATIYIGGLRGTAVPYTEFATFPSDRIISSSDEGYDAYGITYYVNESGTQDFRSDFPTAKNASTQITAKVTARHFRAFIQMNYGWSPTGIDEEQFENGVLTDISDGIDMLPGYTYYIEYTATMADQTTEKRTQTIIVYDMAERIADVFTGASFTTANQIESVTVENAYSSILGSKMLNIAFGDHSDALHLMRQVFWSKAGVAVAGDSATQRLEFLIYNPNDFAISMFNVIGINSMWTYGSIEPHTYLLWDPYSIPGYQAKLWGDGATGDGLISAANELNNIGFYFQAANGAAGNIYVGEFMATLPTSAE